MIPLRDSELDFLEEWSKERKTPVGDYVRELVIEARDRRRQVEIAIHALDHNVKQIEAGIEPTRDVLDLVDDVLESLRRYLAEVKKIEQRW